MATERTRRHPRAMARRLTCAIIAGICFGALAAAQPVSDEYRLKAAFVYRFPQFVEWPAAALQSATTVDVCVLAPNPFGTELDHLVTGESVARRPLRVRLVTRLDDLRGCHALFVGARSAITAAALKAVAGRPVLTIGEGERFLDDGGIIALTLEGRRVRFEVHAAHARAAGLRINAQLLNLAAAVHGGRP